MEVKTILGKQELSKTDLVALLDCRDTTEAELFRHSRQLRDATIGNGVHMRGLIEISNASKIAFIVGSGNRTARPSATS